MDCCDLAWVCDDCETCFFNEDIFEQHACLYNSGGINKQYTNRKCSKLDPHSLPVLDSSVWVCVCDDCETCFFTDDSYQQHLRTCRGTVDDTKTQHRRFRCELCHVDYSRLCGLNRHTKIHHTKLPQSHTCNACCAIFQKNKLQCPQCWKAFTCVRSLGTHKKKRIDRYQCSKCGRGFCYMSHLAKHRYDNQCFYKCYHRVKRHTGLKRKSNHLVGVHTGLKRKSDHLVGVHTGFKHKSDHLVGVHTGLKRKSNHLVGVHTSFKRKSDHLVGVHTGFKRKSDHLVGVHTGLKHKSDHLVGVHTGLKCKSDRLVEDDKGSKRKLDHLVELHAGHDDNACADCYKMFVTNKEWHNYAASS